MLQATTLRHGSLITRVAGYSQKRLNGGGRGILSIPSSANILASATSASSIPDLSGLPEVIVIGRANVGKSTFLNAVLGRKNLVRTSKKAGSTKALNFFGAGGDPNTFVVVDAPGYGARGRPESGKLFDIYIQNRKQLRGIYILLNHDHGLKDSDLAMLAHLDDFCSGAKKAQSTRLTLQPIITKTETFSLIELKTYSRFIRAIAESAPTALEPILTSAMQPMLGIDEARDSIHEACGLL